MPKGPLPNNRTVPFLLFTKRSMITQLFHIYKKHSNELVAHSLTVEEMENMIAAREVDWDRWEVQPCYTEYQIPDASY